MCSKCLSVIIKCYSVKNEYVNSMFGVSELSLKYIWPILPYSLRLRMTEIIENFRNRSNYIAPRNEYLVFLPKNRLEAENRAQDRQFFNTNYIDQELLAEQSSSYRYSLISTCLNEINSIKNFVDSISALTILPSEVIIIDGGSSDGTYQELKLWADREKKFKVIVENEEGASIARGRNLAVSKSSTEILLFSDFGSILDKTWAEQLVYSMTNSTAEFVIGWYHTRTVFEWQNALCYFLLPRFEYLDPAVIFASGRSMALRKSLFEKVSGFPECLTRAGEDSLFCYKVKKNTNQIIFCPAATSTWVMPESILKVCKTIVSYSQGDGETGFLFWDYYFSLISRLGHLVFETLVFIVLFFITISFCNIITFLLLSFSFISLSYRIFKTCKEYGVFEKNQNFTSMSIKIFMLFFMISAQGYGFLKGYLRGKPNMWTQTQDYLK